MSVVAVKVFDVPVEWKWYTVTVEHNTATNDHRLIIDTVLISINGQKVAMNSESDTIKELFDLPIEVENVGHTINLTVNQEPLTPYLERYSKDRATWEVEIGKGAKSKLLFDFVQCKAVFKGQNAKIVKAPTFTSDGVEALVVVDKFHFRILRKAGHQGIEDVLFVNGNSAAIASFNPKSNQ
ncbi:unnamed protein product [Caenorhabditis brenneri]